MIPRHRKPTHPGEILQKEFLDPLGMTQIELAEKMKVPVQRVNGLVRGKRNLSAQTAWLLSEVFKTSPEFWMNLQTLCDLYEARQELDRAA